MSGEFRYWSSQSWLPEPAIINDIFEARLATICVLVYERRCSSYIMQLHVA